MFKDVGSQFLVATCINKGSYALSCFTLNPCKVGIIVFLGKGHAIYFLHFKVA